MGCGASDRYLIEDDYDSEFRYRGKPVRPAGFGYGGKGDLYRYIFQVHSAGDPRKLYGAAACAAEAV